MKCVIYGCGAIGKAVAGVSMHGVGAELTFVEARVPVIEDMNRRGGWRVYESETVYKEYKGAKAVMAGSPEADAAAREADCIVTCVGPKALPIVTRAAAKALEGRTRELLVLLYENDAHCADVVREAFGGQPDWLKIEKASIERMSKEYAHDDCWDVLSEPFIPVIVNQTAVDALPAINNPEYFMAADDMSRYYKRKLYTNNLGHAVIGYFGLKKGYALCCDAIKDPEIASVTRRALEESAQMLVRTFGFSESEMAAHVEDLISRRYANEGLSDELERLARDPARKLGPDERLIGTARLCLACGVIPTAICETAREAMAMLGGDRETTLTEVCGLSKDEALYGMI